MGAPKPRPAGKLDKAPKSPEQVKIDARLNQLQAKSGAVVDSAKKRADVGVELADNKAEKALGNKPGEVKKALDAASSAIEKTNGDINKLTDDLLGLAVLPDVMGGVSYNRSYSALAEDIATRVKMSADYLFTKVATLESWHNIMQAGVGADPRIVFNSQYLEALATTISSKTMDKVVASSGLKNYDAKILANCDEPFSTQFGKTGVKVTVGPKFAEAYDKAKEAYDKMPKDNEVAALKELQGGVVGWVLKAMGVKKAEHVAIVRGKHPLSYFLGAVAVVSGGKSFAWASGYWEKGKMALNKHPKTAHFVGPIETAAKAFSGFAGKVDGVTKEFFDKAVSKKAAEVLKLAGDGSKFVEVNEGGKGMKLSEKLDLRGKLLTVEIGKGEKVVFAKDTSGILDKDGKYIDKTKELAEGTYKISNQIAKDTYFADGVKWKISKAA